MHFPLSPHHVQLVAACYPPSAALLSAGPDYKPNSQELSRLSYYASNRPGKITKLSNEILKRITADARKAKANNARARSSLLISLNIFKTLVTECRRDISLLSTPLMSSLDTTLAALPNDLEVVAKVASVFAAWATYTDGRLLGVDQVLTKEYASTVRRFSDMCLVDAKKDDWEDRNKTRLIGLGALSGAVASEALYNSSTQFKSQVSSIVPAFLVNLLQTDITVLKIESESNKNHPLPLTPYFSDFRSRPLIERRAASIHVHVDGDQGPSMADVAGAALRALACVLSQSNGTQVGQVLQATFDSLGIYRGWKKREHCCWFAQKAVEWIQYPYRFSVPTRLVERLLEAQDDLIASDMHRSLLAMIRTVFTVPMPVVNLSTSDVCSNLVSLMLRRISINAQDELLAGLVECVATLGTHIYYADQIHDLACEIIARLTSIDSSDTEEYQGYVRRGDERAMALRSLLVALEGLIRTSNRPHHPIISPESPLADPTGKLGSTPASLPITDTERCASPKSTEETSAKAGLSNRARIPSDVWQETLSFLCDESFAVRTDYSRVLCVYIETELMQESISLSEGDTVDKDGVKRERPLQDGPFRRAHSIKTIVTGDSSTSRFLNALFASLYVLATSPRLGIPSTSPHSPSHSDEAKREEGDQPHVNIIPSTPLREEPSTSPQEEAAPDTSQGSQSSRRKSTTMSTAIRKLNKVKRLLERANHVPFSMSESDHQSSSFSDFMHISDILSTLHEQMPSRTLLKGLPMLLALNVWCETECPSKNRQAAIRFVLLQQRRAIARIWGCAKLDDAPSDAGVTVDDTILHALPKPPFPGVEDAIPLASLSPGDSNHGAILDAELIVSVLAESRNLQLATGLDEQNLKKRLALPWSPENALRDSVENSVSGGSRPESINPVLKLSPALMHISNLSLQSLTRSNRGVGVNDLRDALEGRAGMSNPALSQGKAPSVSSLGAATFSAASGESAVNVASALRANRSKLRALNGEGPRDVRDVLDKLGIGTRNGPNTLKPTVSNRRSNTRSMLIPPYKR